jgi:hypothetical protein
MEDRDEERTVDRSKTKTSPLFRREHSYVRYDQGILTATRSLQQACQLQPSFTRQQATPEAV